MHAAKPDTFVYPAAYRPALSLPPPATREAIVFEAVSASSTMTDDMKDRDWDAFLDGWQILNIAVMGDPPAARMLVAGTISHDRKGRWTDGRTIVTSMVISGPESFVPGNVVEIWNSRYLLGRPRGTEVN